MTTSESKVARFDFAVYPSDLGGAFEPFILEVPTMSGAGAAARRAWWQTFHILGPRGIEPEGFTVCEWLADRPGRLVTSAGVSES